MENQKSGKLLAVVSLLLRRIMTERGAGALLPMLLECREALTSCVQIETPGGRVGELVLAFFHNALALILGQSTVALPRVEGDRSRRKYVGIHARSRGLHGVAYYLAAVHGPGIVQVFSAMDAMIMAWKHGFLIELVGLQVRPKERIEEHFRHVLSYRPGYGDRGASEASLPPARDVFIPSWIAELCDEVLRLVKEDLPADPEVLELKYEERGINIPDPPWPRTDLEQNYGVHGR